MKATLLFAACAATAAILAAGPAHAQVFKCKAPNGRTVYQDGPCEGAQVVDTRSSSGVSGAKRPDAAHGGGSSGAASTKPTHPVLPEKMRR